jgi:hypothetical protein
MYDIIEAIEQPFSIQSTIVMTKMLYSSHRRTICKARRNTSCAPVARMVTFLVGFWWPAQKATKTKWKG